MDEDSGMGMSNLEADVEASVITAGLRAEYKIVTPVLDLLPHVGVRYMSVNVYGYDIENNLGTVVEGDSFHQSIWTFPIGISFMKDFHGDNGWFFTPMLDFSILPAAGDVKAKHDVSFTGVPGSYELESQMMDYFTWQGSAGIKFGNDVVSVGINYALQAGANSTGHGLYDVLRFEF